MGCSDPREKIENEMVKMKMERIIIQQERQHQLKLLKDIDGKELNIQKIPDYIDESAYTNQETKRIKRIRPSSSKKLIKKLKLRKCKSLNLKGIFKTEKDKDNDKDNSNEGIKRKKTFNIKKTSKV